MSEKKNTPTIIKELRQNAGMSQDTLAEKLGMTRSAISLIESGKNGTREITLRALAQVFGVSTHYLLTGEKENHALITIADSKAYPPTVNYQALLAQAEEELGKTPGAYCSRKSAIRAMELLYDSLVPSSNTVPSEEQPIATTPEQLENAIAQAVDKLLGNAQLQERIIEARTKAQVDLEAERLVYRLTGQPNPELPCNGLLTVRLNVTAEEARQLIQDKKLSAYDIGVGSTIKVTNWRVTEKHVQAFLDQIA